MSSKWEKPAFNITPGIRNFTLWVGLGCLVRGTPSYLFGCKHAARSCYCSEMQTLYFMRMTVNETFVRTLKIGSL